MADRRDLPPDIYAALYGPGWEKIPGTREHSELQTFYPNLPIKPEAWDAAVAGWPMSANVEDRRQPQSLPWALLRRLFVR